MAFDDSQNQSQDDEQQKNQANQGAGQAGAQGATALSGGGGGFAGQSGATTPGGSATAGQQPTSSGSWTNLNSYLSANADQSQGMGQTLANTVGQSAQAAQGALSQNVNDFQNQYSSLPTQAQADTNIQSTLANPYQDTAGSAPVTQYQGYLNNSYSYGNPQADGTTATSANPATLQTINGASGQNDYTNTQNAYTTASNNLADTQSESGRDILLQNQYGSSGQQYNPGEQSFDQLLLQQNPSNQQALQSVYDQYNPTVGADTNTADAAFGTSKDLYNANNDATAYNQGWQGTLGNIQTDAQNALQGAITSDTSDLSGRLTSSQSSRDADYQAIQSGIASNQLTADQLQSLGVSPGTATYNVSGSPYLSPEGLPLNLNQVATDQDVANANALQLLAAGQSYGQSANLGLLPGGIQAASPEYTFNNTGFGQATTAAQQSYQNQIASLAASLQGPQAQLALLQSDPNASANNGAGGTVSEIGSGGSNVNAIQTQENALAAQIAQIQAQQAALQASGGENTYFGGISKALAGG